MPLSSLQVAAGSGIVCLLTAVAAWGPAGAPRPWARTLVGEPYRHQTLEVRAPVPTPVRLAAAVAWVVAAVSALRACLLALEILALEVIKDAGSVDCVTFPCEQPVAPLGPSFDALSGGLHGVYLIATGAVIGAFARWARDAARDMNEARRPAPLVVSGALVVAVGLAGLGNHFGWQLALMHVGVVLFGAALIAVARRSASASLSSDTAR